MATTRSRTTDTPKRRTKATAATSPRRTRQPAAAAASVAHSTIAERAYAIFQAEGGGDSLQHWLRAERELAAA